MSLTVAAGLLVVLGTGCGRKATAADCDLIIDRNVELQLKAMNVTEPATVDKRKTEMREAMKGEMGECVGKRITSGMLACVRGAQSTDEIDKCTH